MKKRIILVSLLFICVAALLVFAAFSPTPDAPASADLMPAFDLADEGAAVLMFDSTIAPNAAPAPVAALKFDFSMLLALGLFLSPVSLMKRSASKLRTLISRSNRDASVNDSTSAGPGFGGPLKFPL